MLVKNIMRIDYDESTEIISRERYILPASEIVLDGGIIGAPYEFNPVYLLGHYTFDDSGQPVLRPEIQQYHNAKKAKILKQKLTALDNEAIKYIDGYYSQAQWDKIRAVRVWLKERIAKLVNEQSAAPAELITLAATAFANSPQTLLELPKDVFDEWKPNTQYTAGQVVIHNGVKVLIMQTHLSQAHQPPDMPNGAMLAVYKPYRDAGAYPWLYGEHCLKGYLRKSINNGKWYELIQADAGANIYSPEMVPSVWKLREDITD